MQPEENIENLQLLPDWKCKPDAKQKGTPIDPMPMGGVLGLSEPYVHSAEFVMQTRCQ